MNPNGMDSPVSGDDGDLRSIGSVVFISHTSFGGPFRVGSHHLAEALARLRIDVAHIATPVSLPHLPRISRPEVRHRFESVFRGLSSPRPSMTALTPPSLVPASVTAGFPRLSRWNIPTLKGALRRAALPPTRIVLIDQPLLAGICELFPHARVVYRPTDFPSTKAELRGERLVMARADGVIATSDAVLERLANEYAVNVPRMVLTNGVDVPRFTEARSSVSGLRVGATYVGSLDHRFDWDAVLEMTESHPDVPFRIAGPLRRAPRRPLPPNIELMGVVPYDEVPRLLAEAHVGLLPFKKSVVNQGRSPMKLFEYLAAGLQVVTRSLRTVAAHGTEGIHPYGESRGPAEALTRALAEFEPYPVDRLWDHDWSSRAQTVISFLFEEILSSRRGRNA